MQKILLLLTQDIDKSYVIHVISHSFHHASDTCCRQLKMVILLECFIVKIHELICKPGTWIHGNSDPLRHSSRSHVFKYIYFVCNPTGIMINFLSLNSQADSPRKSLKKLHSQSILQRFYYFAHTWLRRIQNFRRITERSSLRTCHEILQLFQIHKMSLFHPEKSISAISFSDGSSCFPFIISKLISYFSHNPCSKISYFRSTIRYIESPFYIPIEYPFLLCFRFLPDNSFFTSVRSFFCLKAAATPGDSQHSCQLSLSSVS